MVCFAAQATFGSSSDEVELRECNIREAEGSEKHGARASKIRWRNASEIMI